MSTTKMKKGKSAAKVLREPKDENALTKGFERKNGDYDTIEELIEGCLKSPPDQRALRVLQGHSLIALDDMMEKVDPRIRKRMQSLKKTLADGTEVKPGQTPAQARKVAAAKKAVQKKKVAKKPAPRKLAPKKRS